MAKNSEVEVQYGPAYLRRLWGLKKLPLTASIDCKTGKEVKA